MRVQTGQQPVFALVDCNNFYCSCERLFRPDLVNRPVVVLSNNDGCVIARSNEAKALGVAMGTPYFKQKEQLARAGVAVFSSNYALYGDLSARVMQVLSTFSPVMEEYSIDECFLRLDGFAHRGLESYTHTIRQTVHQWTGIPVSVGLGPTKTLAKLASRVCKQVPSCRGVFDLTRYRGEPEAINRILDTIPAGDVWGIGRRYAAQLERRGVHTARQLRDLSDDWVRRTMTVVGLRTVMELRGVPCIKLEEAPPARRSIVSSRSFGRPVELRSEAHEAVASYMSRAAEKLRREGLLANCVSVVVRTNEHRQEDAQYANSLSSTLARATDCTPVLLHEAAALLDRIFRDGYRYKKVGVMLSGLESRHGRQGNLLDCLTGDAERDATRDALMRATDAINARFGRGTLAYAAAGVPGKGAWRMRQEFRSPRYTTVWDELPVVG